LSVSVYKYNLVKYFINKGTVVPCYHVDPGPFGVSSHPHETKANIHKSAQRQWRGNLRKETQCFSP
jgi:hypothetical protein